MPSSSWRLIRGDREATQATPAGPDGRPARPAEMERPAETNRPAATTTVLHGQGRTPASRLAVSTARTAFGGGAGDSPATTAELQGREREATERGHEAGRRRAEAELRDVLESAAAMARQLEEIGPERTSEIAHTVTELALSVARRILQREVQLDPAVLCGALEAAVSTINGSPEAHVLLNPAAVEPVRQAWELLHGRAYLGKRWLFEGDPNQPPGGCVVRYAHGFVDAGLEAQLEEIGIALDRAIPAIARPAVDEEVA